MADTIKYLPEELYPSSMEANVVFNNMIHTSPYDSSEQIEVRPGDRWTFKFTYDDLERDEARELQAFLLSLKGVAGRFYAKDYAFFDRRGRIRGQPKVDGDLNTGGMCKIKDCPSNTTIFEIGDYVKISGRLHMITEQIKSTSSGEADLVFSPPMRVVPADNSLIEYDNFTVVCRLKDDKQAKRVSRDMVNTLGFEALEVV